MMAMVALGLIALLAVIVFVQAFVGANPHTLARGLRYLGALLLAIAALGAFALDRVGLGMLVASMAWGMFTGGHVLPPGFRRARPASAGISTVRTAWIALELDHASGRMGGAVLKGRFAGRRLEAMSEADGRALYNEAAADAETVQLLETFLDRQFGPSWRGEGAGQEQSAPGQGGGAMTRAEALAILGLKEGSTADEIRAAHRRLMLNNHPDRGGSDYLAAKINAAKDILLA